MQALNVHLLSRFLPFPDDELFEFILCLLDHLFDSGGMDSTIGNQLVERGTSNLTADRIKTADNDNTWRIIDDDIHSGLFFKGPNVSTFPTNDSPLHLIIRNINGTRRRLRGMGGGEALQCRHQDFTRLLFALFLHCLFVF